MSKEFSRSFYNSGLWKKTAELYKQSQSGLCEICYSKGTITPGEIVHHKTELTPDNINDESIAIDFNNLQLVCRSCHLQAHGRSTKNHKRYNIDMYGNVTINKEYKNPLGRNVIDLW